jgi:hypothetical protein
LTQKDEKINGLEKEVMDLITSLKMKKGANQTGSVVEFADLKEALSRAKHELWKEKVANEALQLAHSRADMALAASLAVEKERADCLQQEYILACLKIKQLEESLRFILLPSLPPPTLTIHSSSPPLSHSVQSLIAANEKIYSSPGKQHLVRHNEIISKSVDLNGATTSATDHLLSSSSSPSPFITPTKKNENGKFLPEEFLINIPRSAVKLPLDSENSNQTTNSSEFTSIPINPENILQELIHSKLLLASVATELQEEKHLVNVLSKANQRYAEKVPVFTSYLISIIIP